MCPDRAPPRQGLEVLQPPYVRCVRERRWEKALRTVCQVPKQQPDWNDIHDSEGSMKESILGPKSWTMHDRPRTRRDNPAECFVAAQRRQPGLPYEPQELF